MGPIRTKLRRWLAYLILISFLVWATGKFGQDYGVEEELAGRLMVTGVLTFLSACVVRFLVGFASELDWASLTKISFKRTPPVRCTHETEYPSDAQLYRESQPGYGLPPEPDQPYPSDAVMDRGRDMESEQRWRPDEGYPSDSNLLSEAYRLGAELEADAAEEAAKYDLSTPGRFKLSRGEVFEHGASSTSGNESFHESRWISFEGEQLQVNSHGSDFNEGEEARFSSGQDGDMRAWARKLQRSHGIWFPRKSAFVKLCYKLGWDSSAIEAMKRIY